MEDLPSVEQTAHHGAPELQTDKQKQVNGDVSKAVKIKKSQERRNETKMDQNLSLLL